MGMVFGFPHYKRGYNPARHEPGPDSRPLVVEGLPSQVLVHYGLEPRAYEKLDKSWYIESSKDSKYLIREYEGDITKLQAGLEWQEFLSAQKSAAVLKLLKTKAGSLYSEVDRRYFYLTIWPGLDVFRASEPVHILAAAQALGHIHRLSRDFKPQVKIIQLMGSLWPKKIQEKLMDLLTFSSYLKENRALTNFERLFMESFDEFYFQGQEAVQNMILAGYGSFGEEQNDVLINNFVSPHIGLLNNQAIFLDLSNMARGPRVLDLALFLNSYLPVHRWDPELVKKLLESYQEKSTLNPQEKYMLFSQLRFPSRFWLYAYQYFNGLKSVPHLTQSLKLYIQEANWRYRCLDSLDSWLWGGN